MGRVQVKGKRNTTNITSVKMANPSNSKLMDKTMSQSMEFKELTKRDAERCLAMELEKLKRTGNLPQLQAQMIDKEFSGFQKLFTNFLAAESVSAIEWERIEKLPHDAILAYDTLPKPASDEEIRSMLNKFGCGKAKRWS